MFEKTEFPARGAETAGAEEALTLLLAPLVEVAWADGRVTPREADAILAAADRYGLAAHEEIYGALRETMTRRPSPKMTARLRRRLDALLGALPPADCELVSRALLVQARFVAEQSARGLLAFFRGESVCADEEAALRQLAAKFGREARPVMS